MCIVSSHIVVNAVISRVSRRLHVQKSYNRGRWRVAHVCGGRPRDTLSGELPQVLAVGAEKSFGNAQADVLRVLATNVTGTIVPNSGHWIMEENPKATIHMVTEFVNK